MAHPAGPTPEIEAGINAVLRMIAEEGCSLRHACRTLDLNPSTINEWLNSEQYATKYDRARQERAHILSEDLLEVSDDGKNDWMLNNDPDNPGYRLNGEHIARSRLRVDTRKWLASKLFPRYYGEKTEHKVEGTLTVNLNGDFGEAKG